jgi:hypothetical protein
MFAEIGGGNMKTTRLDLMKEYQTYYRAGTTPGIVEFDEGHFLAIEGKGVPGGDEFLSKVEALYALAYGIKKQMKKEGKDFAVAKLEGLWWVESDKATLRVPSEDWRWKLLIRIPEFVILKNIEKSKVEVVKKKGIEHIDEVVFEKITEGECIQVLHVGPYSTEPDSLAKMRKLMKERNLVENGLHHEIYLTDVRRVTEDKMKTILRQPVKQREEK